MAMATARGAAGLRAINAKPVWDALIADVEMYRHSIVTVKNTKILRPLPQDYTPHR